MVRLVAARLWVVILAWVQRDEAAEGCLKVKVRGEEGEESKFEVEDVSKSEVEVEEWWLDS